MHTVAAVIDDGALTFDFAIPCEVFGLDRSDIVDPWYEFLVVAAGARPVKAQTGFTIDTPHGLDELTRADTIVVPGWSDSDVPPSPELVHALRTAHARQARIVSLCTGAFVLAHAGLLDDRTATHPLGLRATPPAALPAHRSRSEPALRQRRERPHERRHRRRARPLPGARRTGPRGRGRRDRGQTARDASAPRRRAGAVRGPPDRARRGRDPRAARVGARAAGGRPPRRRPRHPRGTEHALAQPPLRPPSRHHTPRVAPPRAAAAPPPGAPARPPT